MEDESGRDCGIGLSNFGVESLDRFLSGILLIGSVLLSGEDFVSVVLLSCVGPGLTMLFGSWKENVDWSCEADSFLASDDSRVVEVDSLASDFESALLFLTFLSFFALAFSSSSSSKASLAFTFTGSRLSFRS